MIQVVKYDWHQHTNKELLTAMNRIGICAVYKYITIAILYTPTFS